VLSKSAIDLYFLINDDWLAFFGLSGQHLHDVNPADGGIVEAKKYSEAPPHSRQNADSRRRIGYRVGTGYFPA
jgi:hypothetical protein